MLILASMNHYNNILLMSILRKVKLYYAKIAINFNKIILVSLIMPIIAAAILPPSRFLFGNRQSKSTTSSKNCPSLRTSSIYFKKEETEIIIVISPFGPLQKFKHKLKYRPETKSASRNSAIWQQLKMLTRLCVWPMLS